MSAHQTIIRPVQPEMCATCRFASRVVDGGGPERTLVVCLRLDCDNILTEPLPPLPYRPAPGPVKPRSRILAFLGRILRW